MAAAAEAVPECVGREPLSRLIVAQGAEAILRIREQRAAA